VQRPKTFTCRGVEIVLKAPSHPIGAFSRDCDGMGALGRPSSRQRTRGTTRGSRSPLRARFTLSCGFEISHAAADFGKEGTEIKLAMNSATATAQIRPGANETARIGATPNHRNVPQLPKARDEFAPRLLQRAGPGAVPAAASSQVRDECLVSFANLRGTKRGLATYSCRSAILSPLPPCLADHLGRSRWTDRLRPNFLRGQERGKTRRGTAVALHNALG
jgi:hypothetical protein